MAAEPPVIEISNLTKRYGELTALEDLTLSVHRGQILGLIGPNGAGKTTAIKILVGLAKPTSGTARIAGADCARESRKIKQLVGYMPDGFGAYDNMRVREYLDFFGAAFGIRRRPRQLRIDEVLEITRATYMQDRYVESLSHGMQQRIGIARTLLHDPQVLIFDEPANGLDPQARIEMRDLLLQLAASGKTLIVTSHILPELSRICDQVAIVMHGKLRAFGALDQIMRQVSQRRAIEVQLPTGSDVGAAAEQLRRLLAEHNAPAANASEGSGLGPTTAAHACGEENVSASPAEAVLRFETTRSDDQLSELLAGLVGAGVPVSQFRELQLDLEDAFLSVLREDERAEALAASGAEVPL